MQSKKVRDLALYGIFLAILIIMTFTPLGFIPVGPLRITLLQIPVIVASICFGRSFGMKIGLMFGLLSIAYNTFIPSPTSFAFTPFYSVGGISGGWQSIIIAIVPRVMIAVVASSVYNLLKDKKSIAVIISAILGSLTNTILVLLGIYVFFGSSYASVMNTSQELLLGVFAGIISFNGVVEAIASAIFSLGLVKMIKSRK